MAQGYETPDFIPQSAIRKSRDDRCAAGCWRPLTCCPTLCPPLAPPLPLLLGGLAFGSSKLDHSFHHALESRAFEYLPHAQQRCTLMCSPHAANRLPHPMDVSCSPQRQTQSKLPLLQRLWTVGAVPCIALLLVHSPRAPTSRQKSTFQVAKDRVFFNSNKNSWDMSNALHIEPGR